MVRKKGLKDQNAAEQETRVRLFLAQDSNFFDGCGLGFKYISLSHGG